MMREILCIFAAAFVLCLRVAAANAQTCHSESEIPSSTPDSRFTLHGDATVADLETGLMWARCADGLSGADCSNGSPNTHRWEAALNVAAGSSLGGYSDWRLPNVNELLSLVEQRCVNPAINTAVFPNTPAEDFWSASPASILWAPDDTWHVRFYYGINFHSRRDYPYYVRLVRSAQ